MSDEWGVMNVTNHLSLLTHHIFTMKWRIALGIILLVLLGLSIGWNRESAWDSRFESPADLGRAVVKTLNRGDADGLHWLRVNRDEYFSWIWPAFPASRPPYNFTADFAWSNLNKKCIIGVGKWNRRYGCKNLAFVNLHFERPTEEYEGFKLLRGTVLTVQKTNGKSAELRILGSIVEKDNRYKLLSYED